ncbi:hypothetical protein D918_08363 [Trichuris suis]|nr:hypothetical protein D918_08363 [Trichuris suis]
MEENDVVFKLTATLKVLPQMFPEQVFSSISQSKISSPQLCETRCTYIIR